MPVALFPARLPALGLSPEAEESQYRENDDDCSDPPNDVVHGVLLAANGKCGHVVGSGTWTITTFKEQTGTASRMMLESVHPAAKAIQDVTCDAALNDAIPLGVPACWSRHAADPTVSPHCHDTF